MGEADIDHKEGCICLTTAEMARADQLTIEAGTPGKVLMETAGRKVAEATRKMFPNAKYILVAAGPGNNGGDGYVAARLLAEMGCDVTVASLVEVKSLSGDAAWAAGEWSGPIIDLADANAKTESKTADLVIDALFGAGLTRAIDGNAADFLQKTCRSDVPVVSVDVPSGVDGTTGEVRGPAPHASLTVTFFRPKPGHFLLPGKSHIGKLVVADIGIPDSVGETISPQTSCNGPALWADRFPWPHTASHKYTRGHAIVVSGGLSHTGAARMAARGALRVGAGLVSVASPRSALIVNASHLTAIMLRPCDTAEDVTAILDDPRHNTLAIGPGAGVGEDTKSKTLAALKSKANLVLDADALTSFEAEPDQLFAAIHAHLGEVVLTPHDGEFRRLFPDLAGLPKLERGIGAAKRSGAIVVLKGPDTVIASPDGRAIINTNGKAWLATAGSGDVLVGLITGLLAQGMTAFNAAAAGVWLHGEAGSGHRGPGLIAEDIPEAMPEILTRLWQQSLTSTHES